MVSFPSIEAMEASLSPTKYEELLWSIEFDPPASARLKTLAQLVAQLMAAYYSAHRDSDKHPDAFTWRDFLREPDEIADDEPDDAPDAVPDDADMTEDAPAPTPLHPLNQPGATPGVQRARGHGAVVPPEIFAKFQQAADERVGVSRAAPADSTDTP